MNPGGSILIFNLVFLNVIGVLLAASAYVSDRSSSRSGTREVQETKRHHAVHVVYSSSSSSSSYAQPKPTTTTRFLLTSSGLKSSQQAQQSQQGNNQGHAQAHKRRLLVYLGPSAYRGPRGVSSWGGWHVTLAGRGDYRIGLQELAERVSDAVRPAFSSWTMTPHNSKLDRGSSRISIHDPALSDVVSRLKTAGVLNVKAAGGLHVTLEGLATHAEMEKEYDKLQKETFELFVLDDQDRDTWIPVSQQQQQPQPQQKVTGSGVLLIEMNCRAGARSGPAVILFREIYRSSSSKSVYVDPGGSIDHGSNAEETAEKEVAEESLGLFRLDLTKLKATQVILTGQGWAYQSWVVCVSSDIDTDLYDQNLAVAQGLPGLPSSWRETDDVRKFFVQDLESAGLDKQGDLRATDVDGEEAIVQGRAKAVLREVLRMNRGALPKESNALQLARRYSGGLGPVGSSQEAASRGQTAAYYNN